MVKFFESDLFKAACLIFFGALILNIPAFINGYVFLFPDSADYLSGRIQIFRLPIYSTFARIGWVFDNIWAVAIAQTLILCHLLYLVNKTISGRVHYGFYIVQMFVLMALSSLPYFTAFIMADIFTPILFLALYLLIFHLKTIGKFNFYYLHILIIFAAMAHITNIYLGAGLILFATFFHIIRKSLNKNNDILLLRPAVLLLTSAVFIIGLNFHYFRVLSLSPSSSVFTLANLLENGLARNYLKTACPNANYRICRYVGVLPDEVNKFLWGGNSINHKLGSFIGMRIEAKYIVRNTIKSYPKDVAMHSIDYALRSFKTHAPAKELVGNIKKSSVSKIIQILYGDDDLKAFWGSLQGRDALPYQSLEKLDNWIYPISFLFVLSIGIWSLRRMENNSYLLPLFTIVFIMGNNILCAAFSGLFDRYQARVSWLLIFAVLLMAGEFYRKYKETASKTNAVI